VTSLRRDHFVASRDFADVIISAVTDVYRNLNKHSYVYNVFHGDYFNAQSTCSAASGVPIRLGR